eukprot:gene10961-7606_t
MRYLKCTNTVMKAFHIRILIFEEYNINLGRTSIAFAYKKEAEATTVVVTSIAINGKHQSTLTHRQQAHPTQTSWHRFSKSCKIQINKVDNFFMGQGMNHSPALSRLCKRPPAGCARPEGLLQLCHGPPSLDKRGAAFHEPCIFRSFHFVAKPGKRRDPVGLDFRSARLLFRGFSQLSRYFDYTFIPGREVPPSGSEQAKNINNGLFGFPLFEQGNSRVIQEVILILIILFPLSVVVRAYHVQSNNTKYNNNLILVQSNIKRNEMLHFFK